MKLRTLKKQRHRHWARDHRAEKRFKDYGVVKRRELKAMMDQMYPPEAIRSFMLGFGPARMEAHE
jgi:hypothetical protein